MRPSPGLRIVDCPVVLVRRPELKEVEKGQRQAGVVRLAPISMTTRQSVSDGASLGTGLCELVTGLW